MAQARRTLAGAGQGGYVERRSRFLAFAEPIGSAEALAEWLGALRRAHRDARHCPYAWVADDGGRRASDDGEPPGTGSRPCLGALVREDVCCAAVAVVRIFGGVELGAANLGRAYAAAAAAAVADAGTRTLRPWTLVRVEVPHADSGAAERALAEAGSRDISRAYVDAAALSAWVPGTGVEALRGRLPSGAGFRIEAEAWR